MEISEKKCMQIVKSNSLIQAKYRLSIQEQRIMLLAISQIAKDEELTDQKMYSVHASEFQDFTGVSLKQSYAELKQAALKLKRREVSITEKPNGQGKHEEVLVAGWVQSIRYIKNYSRVDLRFNHDMIPYLNDLKKEFTVFSIKNNDHISLLKMNSNYAYRIYELMMQWRGTASKENICERTIDINWLRDILDLPNSYKAIGELKRRVLHPAIDDINNHSPFWLKVSDLKSGRSITHIKLTFGAKVNQKNNTKTKPDIFDDKFLSQHARPGESRNDAIRRLKKTHKT
jgi:plasmid replication initiation protein